MADLNISQLVEEARAAMASSYSPYSRFRVGAALLCADGRIFRGTNVENVSFVQGKGMKITIDVVFVSKEGEVLHLMPEMAPGKVSPLVRKARAVIELPAGVIAASGTEVGDRLEIGAAL